MPNQYQHFLVYPSKGGLDLTSPPALVPETDFVIVGNAEYSITGGKKKRPGTARYNATAVATGGDNHTFVTLSDFWRHGNTATSTQKFVAITEGNSQTHIYKDDGDGVWDVLLANWGGSSATGASIVIAEGFAVFLLSAQTPRKWDQTTLSNLGASAPLGSMGTYHLRRLFIAGINTLPDQLSFSAASDITDWVGADAGSITISEDDGDRITGLSAPFRGRLYVFKGPNTGSIWALSGRTFSTLQLDEFFHGGLPCVGSKGVITTPNDIYWASTRGIHSLEATQKHGDVEEAYLSYPVQAEFRRLNFTRLNQVASFYHPTRNIVGWSFPSGSATTNDITFVYNLTTQHWSVWQFASVTSDSFMVAATPTTQLPRLYVGGSAGIVYQGDQTTFNDDGTTYPYRLKTPQLMALGTMKDVLTEATFATLTTFVHPVTSSSTISATVTVDGLATGLTLDQTVSGDLLDSTFVMDVSLISGDAGFKAIESDLGDGTGRRIEVEWVHTADADCEILGYAIRGKAHERMPMDNPAS